jgi:hypothetical protein
MRSELPTHLLYAMHKPARKIALAKASRDCFGRRIPEGMAHLVVDRLIAPNAPNAPNNKAPLRWVYQNQHAIAIRSVLHAKLRRGLLGYYL